MMGLKNELNSDKQRQDENKATYCCQNSPAPRGILHHVYVRPTTQLFQGCEAAKLHNHEYIFLDANGIAV